jgi:LacI family transcriptional regulator
VAVDDLLGGRLIGEHLLTLGHRRIAYLGSVVDAATVTQRRAGIRQALAGAGLDPGQALLDVRIPANPAPADSADAVPGRWAAA